MIRIARGRHQDGGSSQDDGRSSVRRWADASCKPATFSYLSWLAWLTLAGAASHVQAQQAQTQAQVAVDGRGAPSVVVDHTAANAMASADAGALIVPAPAVPAHHAGDVPQQCGVKPLSDLEAGRAMIAQCQNSPEWLTELGGALNQRGLYTEAAEHLERALMLAPQSLPAAFAYSVALAGSGDIASAVQLLGQLTRRADLPELQREQLLLAQQRMVQRGVAPVNGWQTRGSAAVRLGYDSNLLGAPNLTSLTLTLPGGDTTLPLEEAGRPKSGAYSRADLRMDATYMASTGRRLDVTAALQQQQSPGLAAAGTSLAELLLETQPASSGPWVNVGLSSLRTQTGTRFHSVASGAGWAWQVPHLDRCQMRLGVELQNRNLASNPVLSGTYSGGVSSWTCAPSSVTQGLAPRTWQIGARWGHDAPRQESRPGAGQHISGLRASARWERWLAEAELLHTVDAQGYSPLLENGKVRRTTRAVVRAEHYIPLNHWSPGLFATVGAEAYHQRASLALFNVRSASAYVSLRKQW